MSIQAYFTQRLICSRENKTAAKLQTFRISYLGTFSSYQSSHFHMSIIIERVTVMGAKCQRIQTYSNTIRPLNWSRYFETPDRYRNMTRYFNNSNSDSET